MLSGEEIEEQSAVMQPFFPKSFSYSLTSSEEIEMPELDVTNQLRHALSKYDPADPLIQEVYAVADAIDTALQGNDSQLQAWSQQWPQKRSQLQQPEK